MSQIIKKTTKAVPKNKKCWIAAVEHLQFPGVGEILGREFLGTCFWQSGDKRKGVLFDPMTTAKKG